MKPAPRQVEAFLKALPGDIQAVLFYGPDQGLARSRAQELIKTRVKDTSDAFNYAELTEDAIKSNPTRLAEEMAALSFTGDARAVYLRDAGDKHAEMIAEALSSAVPATLLVVCGGELPARSNLRKMFEQEKHMAAVACYHDGAQDITGLLRTKLQENGIQAGRGVVDYAVRQMGNDRMITASEIEKLVLYAGQNGSLSVDDAAAVLNANQDEDMNDLLFAISMGEPARADELLQHQLREGTQPIALLRTAMRHFQKLYEVRLAVENKGQTVDAAVGALRPQVFFRDVPKMQRSATRFRGAHILQVMEWLQQAEAACKSSGAIAPGLTCGRVFLRIAALNTAAKAA